MASSVVIGGPSGAADLQAVLQVAQGQAIALDVATADRIKKESPSPKDFKLESNDILAATKVESSLTSIESRASILCRLISLANGSTKLRLAVLQYFVDLLNSGTQLLLTSATTDAAPLQQIADAAAGAGLTLCDGKSSPLSESLQRQHLSAPGISQQERAMLQSGQWVTLGAAAVTIQTARQLLLCGTAVAALSAEALQIQVKAALEDEYAGKAANDVVGSLSALLKDSPRVNLRKAAPLEAFASIPQCHGAADEALASASTSLKGLLTLPAQAAQAQSSQGNLTWMMLGVASKLLAIAELSVKRMAANTTLPRAKVFANAAAAHQAKMDDSPVLLMQRARAALKRTLSEAAEAEQEPSLAAARAAAVALAAACRALAAEALLASLTLTLAEVSTQAYRKAPKAAKQQAANGAKPKASKKGKEGPSFGLGKGTVLIKSLIDSTASQWDWNPTITPTRAMPDGSSSNASSGEGMSHVLQLAQQLQGSREEEEGQGSVPETMGEAAGSLDRRTVMNLQQALKAVEQALNPLGNKLGPVLADICRLIESNQANRKPKAAKGTRDLGPEQMAIREVAFNTITSVFKRHGAVCIDTPVFELRETLMGKYGEDTKLIYDLADQGGEILSLRYDLTVPFARYVAQHAITNMKRYHIAKVYRRDQPQMTKGRFREFYQCDLDIAGSYPSMVPDSEILKVLVEILSELDIGEFVVKLNHRRLLDAMMDLCGVPASKFRAICSAIDKLDKEPWEEVRREMVDQKGLDSKAADAIGRYVRDDVEPKFQGQPQQILEKLLADPLAQEPAAKEALTELSTLFSLLGHMQGLHHIEFNMSLARGLDYYTGVIYEAVMLKSWNGDPPQVGSVAAGGRYDKLVGMFSSKDVPAVGVSIGIERVFNLLEDKIMAGCKDESGAVCGKIRETDTEVLVTSIGKGMQAKRMEMCAGLWEQGVKAEFGYKAAPTIKDALGYADDNGIPFVVLFGESELASASVKVKDMGQGTEEVVNISKLPYHVAKLVEGLGKRTLVATKRQAPASDQADSAAPEQAGSRQQDASAGQQPAS
ncbi:TPA: hypothetical protein ACH3X1_005790 [Trebouxia sp. C0004]